MMRRLGAVVLLSTCIVIAVVPDPEACRVAKFTQVSKFLNVIISWMMGFFMTTAIHRWYQCVNGFLELLDAIRNLQMQFCALGLPDELMDPVLRQAYASAWLLYYMSLLDTHMLAHKKGESHEASEAEHVWKQLERKKVRVFSTHHKDFLLQPEEVRLLKATREPATAIWTWVACAIGRHTQDGWLPPMQSPVYGRIMNLCQDSHSAIRDVRAAVTVQSAFVYIHFLATLVHINNLINAMTLGVVAGLAIGTALIRAGLHIYTPGKVSEAEVAQDSQNLVITAMYCFLGPLIFQAMLLISMDLSQPFGSQTSEIPVDNFLTQLETDMCWARKLVEPEHLCFERPYFKEPPVPVSHYARQHPAQ
jgi:predicted membrane chloride channel (bestrophin family)